MPKYFFCTIFCYGWGMLGPCSSQTTDGWCVIWCFQGVLYAFIYFSTDQYIPSLPAMQLELGGSQGFMTGTLVAAATVATVLPLMNILLLISFSGSYSYHFISSDDISVATRMGWWYHVVSAISWSAHPKTAEEPCRWTFAWKPSLGCSLLACRTAWVGDLCWWCATGRRFRKESWSSEFNLGGKWVSRADEERIEKTKTIKPLDITSHCISKLSGGLIT